MRTMTLVWSPGERPALSSSERAELAVARRRIRELETELEITKRASALFAESEVRPKKEVPVIEMEQRRNRRMANFIVDRRTQKDDLLPKQVRVKARSPLAIPVLLNHHRD